EMNAGQKLQSKVKKDGKTLSKKSVTYKSSKKSIASVSKMRYTSKCAGAECYRAESDGGKMGEVTLVAGGEDGTLVEVEDLFYNTPVRLKFLKSDKAEESDISTFINRFMLSHPEIAFRYYADGRLLAQSFGGGEEEVLVSVYGADILYNTYHIDGKKHGIRVRGYISNQNFFKANRSYQCVFVNGRYIVNSTIAAALTNAYQQYVMKRQYPFYVLYVDMPSEIVDVNVHPNKADVRFSDNQTVYSAIYGVVSAVLDGTELGMQYVIPTSPYAYEPPAFKAKEEKKAEEQIKFTLTPSQKEEKDEPKEEVPFPEVYGGKLKLDPNRPKVAPEEFKKQIDALDDRRDPHYDFEDVRAELREEQARQAEAARLAKSKNGKLMQQYSDLFFQENKLAVHSPEEQEKGEPDAYAENNRFLEESENKAQQTRIDVERCEYKGNLFNTYLIYELGDDAYLIDQHAAHERLIFNRLQEKMENRAIMQQPMLVPYKIHLTPSEDAFLFDCLPLLREIGFDIEEAGLNRFVVNAVPLDLQDISLKSFFEQFLRDLSGLQQIKLEDLLRDKLAMMACKAAIKGGMCLTEEEVKQLLADMNGDITLKCPHGRPTVVKLSKYEIEKMFKRIV
ncbi:MAG: hypothetical protein J6Z36_04340, partial [Clostridia bacterium]|nr:hypothetical protein [Clostridia bacterium]